MRDAAQARLDAADDERRIGIGLAAALRVDGYRVVRALVGRGVRRVGVGGTDFPVGGIAVDHRIHVAGGDAEEQVGFAQPPEVLGRVPVGLADDADAESLRFEEPPHQRHAETRMIDVGVAGDDDDVARVPAERAHFALRHRQERGDAEALRPVLAVGIERFDLSFHADHISCASRAGAAAWRWWRHPARGWPRLRPAAPKGCARCLCPAPRPTGRSC